MREDEMEVKMVATMEEVDVRIRAAEERDLDTFVEMAYELVRMEEEMGATGRVSETRELVMKITKHVYKIWGDTSYLMLVAEDEGEVVGVLVGNLLDKGELYEPRVVAKVEVLYVKASHHRKHVGRALGRMFEALAVREGVRRFETYCNFNNLAVQEGLIKEGFRRETVVMVRDERDKNP